MNDIDRLLNNSSKAELIEQLSDELAEGDKKVVVIVIEDKEAGKFSSKVMTLGFETSYEVYGVLDVAKQDLMGDDK